MTPMEWLLPGLRLPAFPGQWSLNLVFSYGTLYYINSLETARYSSSVFCSIRHSSKRYSFISLYCSTDKQYMQASFVREAYQHCTKPVARCQIKVQENAAKRENGPLKNWKKSRKTLSSPELVDILVRMESLLSEREPGHGMENHTAPLGKNHNC